MANASTWCVTQKMVLLSPDWLSLQWFFKQIQSWTKTQCVNYLVTEAIPNGVPLEVLITPDRVNLWQKHVEQVNRRREN